MCSLNSVGDRTTDTRSYVKERGPSHHGGYQSVTEQKKFEMKVVPSQFVPNKISAPSSNTGFHHRVGVRGQNESDRYRSSW